MLSVISIIVVAYFLLYTLAFSIPIHFSGSQASLRQGLHLEKPELGPQSSFETWLQEEKRIALDRLLRNISPGGSNALDAAPGTIIASPSREYPDYYYQCSTTMPLPSFCKTNQQPRDPRRRHYCLYPCFPLRRQPQLLSLLQAPQPNPRILCLSLAHSPAHPKPLRQLLRWPFRSRRTQIPRLRHRLHRVLGPSAARWPRPPRSHTHGIPTGIQYLSPNTLAP